MAASRRHHHIFCPFFFVVLGFVLCVVESGTVLDEYVCSYYQCHTFNLLCSLLRCVPDDHSCMQIYAHQLYSKTDTILLYPIVTARRNAVQRRQGRRTTALAYYSPTTCYLVVSASILVASANLQASRRHCLADSYLPPSLLAWCAARNTRYQPLLHHGQQQRPKCSIGQLLSEGASPYQACQAAILEFLESYLPFLVTSRCRCICTCCGRGFGSPLSLVDAGDTGDRRDARCGYAPAGLSAAIAVMDEGGVLLLGHEKYIYSCCPV